MMIIKCVIGIYYLYFYYPYLVSLGLFQNPMQMNEKNMKTKKHAFEACLFMLGYDTENLKVEMNM